MEDTPKASKPFQFSTDFTKQPRKNRKKIDGVTGGYDTDFTGNGGPGFNSTYEDGFTGLFDSTNEGDHSSTHYPMQKTPFMNDFPLKEKNLIKKTLIKQNNAYKSARRNQGSGMKAKSMGYGGFHQRTATT